MNVHFIAVGGSVMHNLAVSLRQKGYKVSGSDDEIYEPALSRLAQHDILPLHNGWFPEKIHNDLDAVILGMHARDDNPELVRAKKLGIKIYSFPEYIYQQSVEKKRVVIGGSHGKTTITSMIIHVLKYLGRDFDYLVGAQLEGFELMVKVSDAPLIIIEGDEYLSSAIEKKPKFLFYQPQIALISGIAWDHINVFPDYELYVEQFRLFADSIEEGGALIYNSEDMEVAKTAGSITKKVKLIPYRKPAYTIIDNTTHIMQNGESYPLQIFGEHNLQNLEGARLVLSELGVSHQQYVEAIQSFKGAAKRLEKIGEAETSCIFKDFAHSPSKLKATVSAVKQQYPGRKLVACMELHTFSSLNKNFLKEYSGSMDEADTAIVYYNEHTLKHKKMPELPADEVKKSFKKNDMIIFTDRKELSSYLKSQNWRNTNLLLMSSGNFDGMDMNEMVNFVREK